MAILVSIYRHADADGGDSTNYGVTSVKRGAKMAILLGVEGPYTDAEALTMSGVKLRLVRRNFNGELYIHAEPAAFLLGVSMMSGGNFIYTTDSRFRAVCPYPIPVHDRIEAAQ